jgi:hypothetical protein
VAESIGVQTDVVPRADAAITGQAGLLVDGAAQVDIDSDDDGAPVRSGAPPSRHSVVSSSASRPQPATLTTDPAGRSRVLSNTSDGTAAARAGNRDSVATVDLPPLRPEAQRNVSQEATGSSSSSLARKPPGFAPSTSSRLRPQGDGQPDGSSATNSDGKRTRKKIRKVRKKQPAADGDTAAKGAVPPVGRRAEAAPDAAALGLPAQGATDRPAIDASVPAGRAAVVNDERDLWSEDKQRARALESERQQS